MVSLNLRKLESPEPWITSVEGDACDVPTSIRQDEFDLVYSNSVIEHVGGHQRSLKFAEQVHALADFHWIQTPWRYFPIEPHWVCPGFQFLPIPARVRLARRWPMGCYRDAESLSDPIGTVLSVNLLSITEMHRYFPSSLLVRERVSGADEVSHRRPFVDRSRDVRLGSAPALEEDDMLPYPVVPLVAERQEEVVGAFRSAKPVRYVVIDDFLVSDFARELFGDLPPPDQMPKSRDYMFSDKRELSTLDLHSDISRLLHEVFMSEGFAKFLSMLTGRTVFVDPEYVGGGFHAGAAGSFLDLHTDFNIHPTHDDWLRELNILLYLNPGWEASWGGQLLLTDDPEEPTISVEPRFNRLVIMESTDKSFHGYQRISFPPGRARRSIAAYAYSHVSAGMMSRRTTKWVPSGCRADQTGARQELELDGADEEPLPRERHAEEPSVTGRAS